MVRAQQRQLHLQLHGRRHLLAPQAGGGGEGEGLLAGPRCYLPACTPPPIIAMISSRAEAR